MVARAPLTLPPYTPTDWELRLPGYPVIGNRWRSTSLPDALGSIPSGAEWRLTYQNRTSDEALALLLPWRATGGGQWPLTPLPPETAYGVNNADFLKRLTGTTWTIAREPQKQAVKKGRFNVTIELVYELTFESNYRVPVASARGFTLSVVASFGGGAAQGNLGASATGFGLSIAASFAGGVARGNASASATGFALSIAVSLEGGAAQGEGAEVAGLDLSVAVSFEGGAALAVLDASTTGFDLSVAVSFEGGTFTASADPNFNSVSLLLHMNGSDASTTFTDSSSNNITITGYGNAQISTAQSKFGGASAYFDGNGDYLLSASSLEPFQMGTGNFTVEAFIRPTVAVSGYRGLIGLQSGDIDTLYILNGSLVWYISGTAAGTIAVDTWYHVAASREGTSLRVFIDGALVNTSTNSNNITFGRVHIGTRGALSGEFFRGWIDELRVTKGVARYTANFTPPTAAFPDGSLDASTTGFDLSVAVSLEAGAAQGDEASTTGFDLSVAVSFEGGAAAGGGFGIEPVDFAMTATPVTTTLGVYVVDTLNSSATLQLLVTPVDFL